VYKVPHRRPTFIAKKVRKSSEELKILRLLNAVKPGCEHIINMHDSFDASSRSWVILPQLSSVADYLYISLREFRPHVTQVCSGLIEGLAHLHELCIAHRDIKPDNLVVDRDFCAKIIDFDVAIQLKDEDEEVSGYCGTEHWTAPEVMESESLAYSPIKADRWSCGHLVLYLLDRVKKEDKSLRSFAMKLKAGYPQQRPSLAEWRTSKSAVPPTIAVPQARPHSPEAAEPRIAKRTRQAPLPGEQAQVLVH
jgi:serine/threonine protein kinase